MKLRVYLAGYSRESNYRRIVKKEYGDKIDLIDPIEFHRLCETNPKDIPPKDKELILSCRLNFIILNFVTICSHFLTKFFLVIHRKKYAGARKS